MANRNMCSAMGFVLLAALLVLPGFGGTAQAAENVYGSINVQPLAIDECARCHFSHFNRIKDMGAKHQGVLCTECHEIFHAYNPVKGNYAELMPKCSSCHNAPHGEAEQVQNCLKCHTDPHQPLAAIPDPANLEDQCSFCHNTVAASLKAQPSKHTVQKCSSCHSKKHGRIPECSECHENHSPLAALAKPDCMACHPVHTPLAITYPLTQAKEVCAGCHENAYNLLKDRVTRHTVLTCAQCHPSHGEVPECQRCHGEPHGDKIHVKYKVCGTCHGIAHDVLR